MGAPYVIFCSEDDDLAPVQVICNFVHRLEDLGADVKLVKWINSSHVGMLLYTSEFLCLYHARPKLFPFGFNVLSFTSIKR